jgi:hypothetical protein
MSNAAEACAQSSLIRSKNQPEISMVSTILDFDFSHATRSVQPSPGAFNIDNAQSRNLLGSPTFHDLSFCASSAPNDLPHDLSQVPVYKSENTPWMACTRAPIDTNHLLVHALLSSRIGLPPLGPPLMPLPPLFTSPPHPPSTNLLPSSSESGLPPAVSALLGLGAFPGGLPPAASLPDWARRLPQIHPLMGLPPIPMPSSPIQRAG